MSTKIYAENLSATTTDMELMNLFSPYGNVVDVNIAVDQMGQESRRSGTVTMVTSEGARAAIRSLNGKVIGGSTLALSETRSREETAKSRGAGRHPRRCPSFLY